MLQIKNPVLPGFNADPSIIRVLMPVSHAHKPP